MITFTNSATNSAKYYPVLDLSKNRESYKNSMPADQKQEFTMNFKNIPLKGIWLLKKKKKRLFDPL